MKETRSGPSEHVTNLPLSKLAFFEPEARHLCSLQGCGDPETEKHQQQPPHYEENSHAESRKEQHMGATWLATRL